VSIDAPHTLTLHHKYTPMFNDALTYHTTARSTLELPAYAIPRNLVVDADLDHRKILVNFDMPAVTGFTLNDSIYLHLTTTLPGGIQAGDTLIRLAYDPLQSHYTYEHAVPAGMDQARFNAEVYRSFANTDGWFRPVERTANINKTKLTGYADYDAVHAEITGAEAVESNMLIAVKWDKKGTYWSTGTALEILRTDLSQNNATYSVRLTKREEWAACRWVDRNAQRCHSYFYSLRVVPGGDYQQGSEYETEPITIEETPQIYSFEASQGEYPDRVELRFSSQPFTRFIIERRLHGETQWEQALTTNTLSSNNRYVLSDVHASSGVIYDYRLIGAQICGGDTMYTDSLQFTDFGFRRASGDFYGRVTFQDGSSVDSVDVRLTPPADLTHHCLHFADGEVTVKDSTLLAEAREFSLQAVCRLDSAFSGDIIDVPGVMTLTVSNGTPFAIVAGSVGARFSKGRVNDLESADAAADSIADLNRHELGNAAVEQAYVGTYMSLSASFRNDTLFTFFNGDPADTVPVDASLVQPRRWEGDVVIGEGFRGDIDEVRIWSRGLTADDVRGNHNRYLIGNETGLDAYYNFDFAAAGCIFDQSFVSTASGDKYNRRHGIFAEGVVLATSTVPSDMLAYAGMTNKEGVYQIRNVPYFGNGTAYMMAPVKGTHQFNPTSDVRYLSSTSSSHTVNFTDVSSFNMPVKIVYAGGHYPVEGVWFEIDGKVASKGVQQIMTDAEGEAVLSVPIGVHTVRAVKTNHVFSDDGYITDVNGQPLDYQDHFTQRTLQDSTMVLYVGRVAGGKTQGELAVGFGLSNNNLSNNITVTLEPTMRDKHNIVDQTRDSLFQHRATALDSIRAAKRLEHGDPQMTEPRSNDHWTRVNYAPAKISIHPDTATGEFYAWLPPVKYQVSVSIEGHDASKVENNNTVLDLTAAAGNNQASVLSNARDSIRYRDGSGESYLWSDRLNCGEYTAYTLRYQPVLTIVPVSETDSTQRLDFFGDSTLISGNDTIRAWDRATGTYYFGYPVFQQGDKYKWYLRMSEDYEHAQTHVVDHVGADNVTYSLSLPMATASPFSVEGDSLTGEAYFTFQPDKINITEGIVSLNASAKYGSSDHQYTVLWNAPFRTPEGQQYAYCLGSETVGNDFYTEGPNHIVTVLRDPPGSGSFAYLSENVNWSESKSYVGSEAIGGALTWTKGTDFTQMTLLGMTVINRVNDTKISDNVTWSITQKYEGKKSWTTTYATTTKVQTSAAPGMVGAPADLYMGYSTNVIIGQCNRMHAVSKDYYDRFRTNIVRAYSDTSLDHILVEESAITEGDSMTTTFLYAQDFIIKTEIPKIRNMRNTLLILPSAAGFEADSLALQNRVDDISNPASDSIFYLSRIADPQDSRFGQDGQYIVIFNLEVQSQKQSLGLGNFMETNTATNEVTYSQAPIFVVPDKIHSYNQWISQWEDCIRENEAAKVNAEPFNNWSVSSGQSVSYSEAYSAKKEHNHTWSFTIGRTNEAKLGTCVISIETRTGGKSDVNTTHGGTSGTSAQRSQDKGFTIVDGDNGDYMTVDVCREPHWNIEQEIFDEKFTGVSVNGSDMLPLDHYPSFIFKLRAGAMSCPCELGDSTIYYKVNGQRQPLWSSTLRRDKPTLRIDNPDINNVPSGEAAQLRVHLGNESETAEARIYNLVLNAASNPNGAVVMYNGNSLSNAMAVTVPVTGMDIVLTVERGMEMEYEGLELMLMDNCSSLPAGQRTVAKAQFNIRFVRSCTQVEILEPQGQWVYNTNLETTKVDDVDKHYMPVRIGGYNGNYENIYGIDLCIKKRSDSRWTTLKQWTREEVKADPELTYNMMLDDDFIDGELDLMAVSHCGTSAGDFVDNSSAIREGVKDMVCPTVYGRPKPESGILTAADNLEIVFNEAIAQGRVSKDNFSVLGTLNGSDKGVQNTFISLDGRQGYLYSELPTSFAHKNVTVEMLVRPHELRETPIFAHGNQQSSLELGMLPSGKLQVRFGETVYTSEHAADLQVGSWNQLALVWDTLSRSVSVYCNAQLVMNQQVNEDYNTSGTIQVGHCPHTPEQHFLGDIAQLRIFNRTLTVPELQAVRTYSLGGHEYGLLNCYKMNEGKGGFTEDHTRGVNLTMKEGADWTLPAGYSLHTTGRDSYADLRMQRAVTDAQDWTLSLWARIQPDQQGIFFTTDTTPTDAQAVAPLRLSVESGKLVAEGLGGYTLRSQATVADGQWHSLTLAVSRSMAYSRLYIDGQLDNYSSSQIFGPVATPFFRAGGMGADFDEVQLWNLYRSQSQVENEYNYRINPDQTGLIGYWPMQRFITHQGAQMMDTTLLNMADSLPAAGISVNASLLSSPAPTNEQRALDNLRYSITTSEKGILLTLLDRDEQLEDTYVSVSVKDIYDLQGNPMQSPVSWSAFVSRSQVYWLEDVLQEQMRYYSPYSFSNMFVNTGGSQHTWRLTELPQWLSADKLQGKLEANSYQTVNFTVDEGLSIGTYTEVIYLELDNETRKPLYLTITVRDDQPEWESAFGNSAYGMSVFAQMKFADGLSTDTLDMIGAFIGDKCVGAAQTRYVRQLDMYYALVPITYNRPSGSKGKALTWRIWDASEGRTYTVIPSDADAATYYTDRIVGSPTEPVLFEAGDLQNLDLPLSEGWNWVSFPLQSAAMSSVSDMFGSGWPDATQVKSLSKVAYYYADRDLWDDNQHLSFSTDSSYMLYLTEPYTYTHVGTPMADPTQHPIGIRPGWNWIGYLTMSNLPLRQALAGYEPTDADVIKSGKQFAMYVADAQQWIGTLTYMTPGCGYMLYNASSAAKTLVYPRAEVSGTTSTAYAPATRAPHTMVVFASTDDWFTTDRIVAVDAEGTEHDASVVQFMGRPLFLVSLSSEGRQTLFFRRYRDGKVATAQQMLSYDANAVEGTPEEPLNLVFGIEDADADSDAQLYNVLGIPVDDPQHTGVYVSRKGKLLYNASQHK